MYNNHDFIDETNYFSKNDAKVIILFHGLPHNVEVISGQNKESRHF